MVFHVNKDRFFSPLLISTSLFIYYTIGFINPYNISVHNISITKASALKTYLVGLVGILFYILGSKLVGNKVTYYEKGDLFVSLKRYRIAVILCTIVGVLFALPMYIKLGLPIMNLDSISSGIVDIIVLIINFLSRK